jgi:hypothetical protein
MVGLALPYFSWDSAVVLVPETFAVSRFHAKQTRTAFVVSIAALSFDHRWPAHWRSLSELTVEATHAVSVLVARLVLELADTEPLDALLASTVHIKKALPTWVKLSSAVVGICVDTFRFELLFCSKEAESLVASELSGVIRPHHLMIDPRHAPLAEHLGVSKALSNLDSGQSRVLLVNVCPHAPVI